MNEPCKWVLVKVIGQSRVRLWDVLILIPNLLFLTFLLFKVKAAKLKLKLTRMPVISAFYFLIWFCVLLNILRCLVYMTMTVKDPIEDTIDKLIWLVLKFFMLSTELSVLIFALAFGRIDSNKSVRWVIFYASMTSLIYSIVQGYLELSHPDPHFHIKDYDYNLFGHGGVIFLFITSLIFTMMYLTVIILPKTKLRDRIALPTKKTFYYYCAFLASLNILKMTSSCLMIANIPYALCVINLTTFVYLTTFAPIVYRTFLKGVFKITYANLFAYKPQINELGTASIGGVAQNHLRNTPYSIRNHAPSLYLMNRNDALPFFRYHDPLHRINWSTGGVGLSKKVAGEGINGSGINHDELINSNSMYSSKSDSAGFLYNTGSNVMLAPAASIDDEKRLIKQQQVINDRDHTRDSNKDDSTNIENAKVIQPYNTLNLPISNNILVTKGSNLILPSPMSPIIQLNNSQNRYSSQLPVSLKTNVIQEEEAFDIIRS